MQSAIQKLFVLIKTFDLPAEKKAELLVSLQNEQISAELLAEIESLLEMELNKIETEISDLDSQITGKKSQIAQEKKDNLIKKQNLQQSYRAGLKKIFEETLMQGKKVAGEIDQEEESQKHQQEAGEIEALKKKLGGG